MRSIAISIVAALLVSGLASPTPAQPIDAGTVAYAEKSAGLKAALKSYEAAKAPKAMAINPNGRLQWWAGQGSDAEASRRALESCEFAQKSPCVLAIVGNAVQKIDRAAVPVSAFAGIGDEFDQSKVPFLGDESRAALAASIVAAQRLPTHNVLIVVLHPRGQWWTQWNNYGSAKTGRGNELRAEADALHECRSSRPPDKSWSASDCILYAQDNKVVAKLP
jgi:hypothetical protein